jgi:dipeptidase
VPQELRVVAKAKTLSLQVYDSNDDNEFICSTAMKDGLETNSTLENLDIFLVELPYYNNIVTPCGAGPLLSPHH